jgi:hypothetical protein
MGRARIRQAEGPIEQQAQMRIGRVDQWREYQAARAELRIPKAPQAHQQWVRRCEQRARQNAMQPSTMARVRAYDDSRNRRRAMVVFGD